MNVVPQNIIDNLLGNKELLKNILYSLFAFLIVYGTKKVMFQITRRKEQDAVKHFAARKLIGIISNFIFLIVLSFIWYDSSAEILSFLGFFTAGMAIAMRDIILNMIGALYIFWAAPFKIGDRIEVAGQIGDVIDVKILQFSMLEVGKRISGEQSTGRILHIPNMYVFNYPLSNYEKGFKYIWNEVTVPIAQDSNWELAKQLIYGLLEEYTEEVIEEAKTQIDEAGRNYLIYYNNLTPMIYTELKDHQILLTVRYLCEPRKVRITEHMIWEAVLKMTKEQSDVRLG